MKPLILVEIPGLTGAMVREHAPALAALCEEGAMGSITPDLPAVTMTGHASMMTGLKPAEHGIVANGYFDRALNQVFMWPQSEWLVHGEKIWEAGKARDAAFTCLKHFWWPGMASTADVHVNVRPVYHADGRKAGGVYANQPGLADELQKKFGTFPLFKFWGPGAGIESTRWIVDTAVHMMQRQKPTLSLVYLPHLDYRQQTLGPDDPQIAREIRALDQAAAPLWEHAKKIGAGVIVLSGYAIVPVSRPVHLNRVLRDAGWLSVVTNAAGERLDFGASKAFALADHQAAHIYIDDKSVIDKVRHLIEGTAGVARVLDATDKRAAGLDHPRAGELIALAEPDAWFTYYYWLDDRCAPDFARTVAIHDKPGYDPCEMLIDPKIGAPKLKIVGKLARKAAGMRYLMDVIPLDAALIKGSHGLAPASPEAAPVCLSNVAGLFSDGAALPMDRIKPLCLRAVFES